jgi:hypothetical protein
MTDLIGAYVRARRTHRLLVPVRVPGNAARAFRAGANLAPDRAVGRRTWEEFLADRVGSSSDSRTGADEAKGVPEAA